VTGPRSEGVKVDRERRIRRVPKGEDYLYTESGGGPALAPFCAGGAASHSAREKNDPVTLGPQRIPGPARMLKFSPLSPDLQPVGGKAALVPSISAVNAWNRCAPQSPGDEVRSPCGVCHRRFLLVASPVLNCSSRVPVPRAVGRHSGKTTRHRIRGRLDGQRWG
jgi:hypothetical protein